jgi:YggT family protein
MYQNFLFSLIDVVDALFNLLLILIIIRALMSWFRPDPHHPIVRFIYRITSKILDPIQRIIPSIGGLDLSPIVAIFLIQIVQRLLIGNLEGYLLQYH